MGSVSTVLYHFICRFGKNNENMYKINKVVVKIFYTVFDSQRIASIDSNNILDI